MSNMFKRNSSNSPKNASFSTLDRELSIRINHPNKNLSIGNNNLQKEMSIQTNYIQSQQIKQSQNNNQVPRQNNNQVPRQVSKQAPRQVSKQVPRSKQISSYSPRSRQTSRQVSKQMPRQTSKQVSKQMPRQTSSQVSNIESNSDQKMKFVSVDKGSFKDYYSFANKMGQNYNTDLDSDLRYSESTRRKTLPASVVSSYKKTSNNMVLETLPEEGSSSNAHIMGLISNENYIKSNPQFPMNFSNTAAKIPKASEEYWDNTKRHNLDTSTYTNNPSKIQGRGFGDINRYDLFLNGVGVSTRQEEADFNPRNVDNDRIYLTNHNYHYDKHHITDNLPCGADTRYLNKKMI
jgi:hypothetical protein